MSWETGICEIVRQTSIKPLDGVLQTSGGALQTHSAFARVGS